MGVWEYDYRQFFYQVPLFSLFGGSLLSRIPGQQRDRLEATKSDIVAT
jgi:hypothetical protein